VVTGHSASDFHIPAVLSITTPSINDTSTISMPSAAAPVITTVAAESLNEQIDEVLLNAVDQIASTTTATIIDEQPIDDQTKYSSKRR
jgi:hypothetical protein